MISEGLSTFMVEMTETATILQHATSNSIIIMDEIGRGTSTYDGISIAWAIAEFLVSLGKARPLTLFATHYHELQELADEYPEQIKNGHMAVSRHKNTPIFLYQLQEGAAEHSFGVDVAKLAGVHSTVTQRAETLLQKFEDTNPLESKPKKQTITGQAPLLPELGATQKSHTTPKNPSHQELITQLKKVSLENTTPLQALNLLAKLKSSI